MVKRVLTLTEPSLPSFRTLKKHFLLFLEIIPGQIEMTPREKPIISVVINLIDTVLEKIFFLILKNILLS